MGSAKVVGKSASGGVDNQSSGMGKKKATNSKSTASDDKKAKPNQKRSRLESNQNIPGSRKMPKRAAACSDFKDKTVRLSEKSSMVETKRDIVVEDEVAAISLTSGINDPRPNRRLTDFIFHDADGKAQSVEMLEVDDLFITGGILSLEENSDKEKGKGVRCEGFGRIESWDISGYEEGSPIIWISTEFADYDCVKPATSYKKLYDLFFEKACLCIEIYKKLSKTSGGNPDLSVDELISQVVRSMSGSKNFPHGTSVKDFIVSQGEFVYNQLTGLDETSGKNDLIFRDLPVLAALKDESKKHTGFAPPKAMSSGGSLKIGEREKANHSNSPASGVVDDEDMKLARLLQEEENWRSMKQKKGQRSAASSNKFYIKINEDEIADDYPLPAYYKTTTEETDEYIIFDNDICDPNELPRSMLHDWSLYNSDSRLISLELLPMKPCADIDVTIFGSGFMTADDGSGFCLDSDPNQSSSGSCEVQNNDGIPIYLSAIKEWMIEFGASMIFISIRTDMAWYRLGKPSKQYAPWYEPVLKTARLAIGIITLLKEQSRVSRLSFADVVKRVSEFDKNHPAYISSTPSVVERYAVVHGQIMLQQFAEYPDDAIRKSSFVTSLHDNMERKHHTKWLVKKKMVLKKEGNMNPRAAMAPLVSIYIQ